jgi:hypothetical protein
VFYRLVLTEPKKVTLTAQLSPTSWNTYVALSTTCGDASTELGCANGTTATLTRNFLDAGTYFIAVDADTENPFTLNVRLDPPIYPPANDRCPGTNISGGGLFTGTMVDTYRDYPPSCSTASLSDVVYEFTTTAPQDVSVLVTPLGAAATYVATLRTTCDDRATEMICRSGNPAQFTRRGLAAGTYYIIVSGPTAAPANRFVLQLTIDPATPVPGNDICSGATDVSAGGTFAGSTSACADDYAPSCGASTTYPDIVYNLTLASPQDVTLDLSSAAPTSYLDLRSGTCGIGMTSLRCVSGAGGHVFNRSVPAGTYWILVDTSIEASTSLDVTLAPPTTACGSAAAVNIDYTAGSTFTTTLTGTTVGRPSDFVPGCRTTSTAPDVPYRINVPVRSSFSAEVTSAGWDTVMHMRSVCETATTEIACDDDGGACSLCSRVPTTGTLTLEPGSYTLILDGYYTGSGPYTISVTATRL